VNAQADDRHRAPPDDAPLAAGEVLVPGSIVDEHLHRSRYLDIYSVWSPVRACYCVAKVARPDRRADRGVTRDLLREGRLLRRFTHPHLVRAYEVVTRPLPCAILESLPGPTLARLLAGGRPRLPLTELVYLGLHLCSALHYLHGHNLLHLDLTPGNIVVMPPLAKLLDLSIARSPGRGRAGWGTREYMAPEQARGGTFSPATDVWGLGMVLFEAATGQRPFGTDPSPTEYAQLVNQATPIRHHRRLPRGLGTLLDRCLEQDPAQRPTVGALTAGLQELVGAANTPS